MDSIFSIVRSLGTRSSPACTHFTTDCKRYLADAFAEQQALAEQQSLSAVQPLPSALQQLAPSLQQSAAQQLEPSVQQFALVLQTLSSLQQPDVVGVEAQQLAVFCDILHFVVEDGLSVAALPIAANPRTRIRTMVFKIFICIS
jgi:hypothetical protein